MAKRRKFTGKTTYTLEGVPGLDLAECVLIGEPNRSKFPQRRPLVLTLEELHVLSFGTVGRELDRAIELLSLGPKQRAKRLEILLTLRRKIQHL